MESEIEKSLIPSTFRYDHYIDKYDLNISQSKNYPLYLSCTKTRQTDCHKQSDTSFAQIQEMVEQKGV